MSIILILLLKACKHTFPLIEIHVHVPRRALLHRCMRVCLYITWLLVSTIIGPIDEIINNMNVSYNYFQTCTYDLHNLHTGCCLI